MLPSRFQYIDEFVSGRYPGVLFSFLFGSTAIGQDGVNSDVDIIVVVSGTISPFREKVRSKGRLFDVFIYDVESLHGALIVGRASDNWVMIEAIQAAVVLPVESPISQSLQDLARRIWSLPPPKRTLDNGRQFITSLIDDLEFCKNEGERLLLMNELLRALVGSLLMVFNRPGFSRKQAARFLADHHSQLVDEVYGSFKKSVALGSDEFMVAARKILDIFGGPLREGYRSAISDAVRIPLDPVFYESNAR